jgi:hypothetical protein
MYAFIDDNLFKRIRLNEEKPAIVQSTDTKKTHSKFKLLLILIESVSFD